MHDQLILHKVEALLKKAAEAYWHKKPEDVFTFGLAKVLNVCFCSRFMMFFF